ncbi:MAG: hypothetical protein BYD32DRAFT_422250 [Podila humilis]|nr:MAG: hypothetical protein BYD32DRAFT_422250 [Podila humilis]
MRSQVRNLQYSTNPSRSSLSVTWSLLCLMSFVVAILCCCCCRCCGLVEMWKCGNEEGVSKKKKKRNKGFCFIVG